MSQDKERDVQEFVISDALWELIEPLMPVYEKKVHPLGCYRSRVPDRKVLNGIFFVLRTGCQWKALDQQVSARVQQRTRGFRSGSRMVCLHGCGRCLCMTMTH